MRERGDQLERVGACKREGQRAHHEMQPPDELFLRQLRQRAPKRGLESRDHHGILVGQKMPDERRWIGVGTPQEAQEILAAALGIARELERRNEHRRENLLAGQRLRRDRKSTRLNSSHRCISYAVFCLKAIQTPDIYTLSLHDALPI